MDRSQSERLIDRHGPAAVIAALAPFLTARRKARIEAVIAGRLRSVEVAIEAPSVPHNAAAVVRTAEAFGVLGVHVIAAQGRALHAKATTQGSYRWVDTHHHACLDDFLAHAESAGLDLYGAWMDGPMTVDEIPVDRPLCLLLGNEATGLSDRARARCRSGFRIPMVGMSESLNLSVSAAIGLYDVCRRRRAHCGASDLDADARVRLRARYHLQSVDDRMIRGILRDAEPPEVHS
jgi:tRNA (guanosine-2'-O-)-methyltransferase